MNKLLKGSAPAVCTALVMLSAAVAHGQKSYVIPQAGGKIEGDAITADAQGNIQLKIGEAVRTFRRGQYKRAYTPKPRAVRGLEQALDRQQYDVITDRAQEIFERYRFLGWAGLIGHIRAEALLAKGDARQALRVVENAESYAHFNLDRLNASKAKALLELGRNDDAREIVAQLKSAGNAEIAAFAFNAAGKLNAQEGKKKEAVLEYLKTVLVLGPQAPPSAREEARREVAALLEDIGDPRYEEFQE